MVNHNNTDYTVIAIGDYAFQNYATITSVTIPNSITEIGQGAFRNCSAIKSLTIPNSVTTIEKYAFVNCSALTEINVENGNKITALRMVFYSITIKRHLYNILGVKTASTLFRIW